MVSLNPVRILKNEAAEEKAETARMSSFIGAIAVGDLVKSTLGPKGMDKILVSSGRNEGQVEVTNDGATILKNIGVDNPAAKVLVDISRVQDDEVGDGTTSVTVLENSSVTIQTICIRVTDFYESEKCLLIGTTLEVLQTTLLLFFVFDWSTILRVYSLYFMFSKTEKILLFHQLI
ncbi:T-complex protein 1 subunit beta-like isoform X1 [Lycorma delicatula]|uniref:T-complex protein 1 subunit beta-like isoform X1 n=1 Tax=Lycorma delicatula TaxID=130591 RepID=UPI003F5155AE